MKDITIYDVAKALNLSASTVSRGLKDHPHIKKETTERIKAVAGRMGYQKNKFAVNLRQRHTNTLGLIVPKLNSYFMATVISGIERVTNENGYGLIISTSQESAGMEAANVTTMFNSRVDGLMVSLASDTAGTDHLDIFLNKNIPVIFFDRVADCGGCMKVLIDNCRAGFEVTSHLIEQGCSRIVHVGGNMLRNVYSERFAGYRKALSEYGLKFEKSLHIVNDLSRETAGEAAGRILRMKKLPDGIFAANDTTAVTIVLELLGAGIRIPDDVCVAGFNNEPISRVIRPNLTTVDYPAEQIGEIVATSLIRKLRGNDPDNGPVLLGHRLIVRESTLRNT